VRERRTRQTDLWSSAPRRCSTRPSWPRTAYVGTTSSNDGARAACAVTGAMEAAARTMRAMRQAVGSMIVSLDDGSKRVRAAPSKSERELLRFSRSPVRGAAPHWPAHAASSPSPPDRRRGACSAGSTTGEHRARDVQNLTRSRSEALRQQRQRLVQVGEDRGPVPRTELRHRACSVLAAQDRAEVQPQRREQLRRQRRERA